MLLGTLPFNVIKFHVQWLGHFESTKIFQMPQIYPRAQNDNATCTRGQQTASQLN